MVDSEKRISLAEFLRGLEQDEVYCGRCHTLLQRYAAKHHLKIDDSAPVAECLRVLLDIWIENKDLPLYHRGSGDRVVFSIGIQSKNFLSGHCGLDYEIDKNDLEHFLRKSGLPLPAPGRKEENYFWFHGVPGSTTEKRTLESIAAADEAQEKRRQKGLAFHVASRVTNKDSLKSCALGLGGVALPNDVDPKLVELYARRIFLVNGAKKTFDDPTSEAERRKRTTAIESIDKQINGGRPDEEQDAQPPSTDNLPLAADNTAKRAEQHFATLPETEWCDIRIEFFDLETIKITVGSKRPLERSYKSFSCFHNEKTKKPRNAWFHLLALAMHKGNHPHPVNPDDKITVKHVSTLQKDLKCLFPEVNGKPFEKYRRGFGWKPRIILSLSKSLSGQYRI